MTRIAVALTAILASLPACHRSEPPAARSETPPRIELRPDLPGSSPGRSGTTTVDVVGLPADELSRLAEGKLTPDQWTGLLHIVVAADSDSSAGRPAVLGTYGVRDGVLRFTPTFPFDPGQRYNVVLDPSRLPAATGSDVAPWRLGPIEASIVIPAPERHATTRVVAMSPGGTEVPENLLRLYISFSAPMSVGGGSGHVHLLDQTGRPVEDPFLPLDVDLWNEDRTRYTVLFDPGRVKRGILPNEEMGRPLAVGRTYTLVVDQDWRDATGQSLTAPFRRDFRVGPPEERAIDPSTWRLVPSQEGTRDPLVVTFPRPLDYGLLQRALTIFAPHGDRLRGEVRLDADETRWLFVPQTPWQAGTYQLLASSILEDVAGNRIGRPFEVEALERGRLRAEAKSAALTFSVAPRTR